MSTFMAKPGIVPQRWFVIDAANQVVGRYLGRRALLWRLLNAAGAARAAVVARVRGNRELAAHWRRQVPAHLGLRSP